MLILVCVGAVVIVLVAVASAVLAVRRTVYNYRSAGSCRAALGCETDARHCG